MNWPKSLSKKIKTKVNLAGFTAFKIGGPAEFFFTPAKIKELQDILSFARKKRIRIFMLGAGSNILVSDRGVKGLVIKLSGKYFNHLSCSGTCLVAGGGLKLSRLILFAKTKCLTGLEFLAGIPGTLGGSVIGNAGAWGESIGGLVKQVSVLDYNGRRRLLSAKQLKFSYRKSNLNKYIILWAKLKLRENDKGVIASEIKRYLLMRRKTQGTRLPNAGCIFKNPAGLRGAGKLIDLCGLKGKRKNKAIISARHANFILNSGRAKCRDVLFLMDLMRRKVKSKFGINLRKEIKLWR